MLAALRFSPRCPTLVVRSSIATDGSAEKRSTTAARSACGTEPSMRRYVTPGKQGRNSADSATSRAALFCFLVVVEETGSPHDVRFFVAAG